MRQLAKAVALAAATAVATTAAAQFGKVMGFTTITCSDEIVYSYDNVAEACADHGIRAYMDRDESMPECRICRDDEDDGLRNPPLRIIIIPSPCPEGKHRHGSHCHADHKCGDDEIGGGSEECEPCGEGKVPNEDGTACRSCPHGESGDSTGVCAADPCGLAAVDAAAAADLKGVPREGRERGRFFYCEDDKLLSTAWSSSGADKCFVTIAPKYERDLACWRRSPRPSSCNLAAVHTHPYFTKADEGAICGGVEVDEEEAIKHNTEGMSFGQNDLVFALANDVDAYLGVPNRSCVKGWRVASGGGLTDVVWGQCKPYEHVPWSEQ